MCEILNIFRDSLQAITDPHYFRDERGFQGQLLTQLHNRMQIRQIFPGEPIVQQEYQKTLEQHGITIRPDIIIHIPFERGDFNNRTQGNYTIIQLKRRAIKTKVLEDFRKIDLMFQHLNYPIGIFLNVDSNRTYYDAYSGNYRCRLHCFAIRLENGAVVINESP